MITSAPLTPQESIAIQMETFTFEAGTPFAESSRAAVHAMEHYMRVREVVDLGCGDGAATRFFQDHGISVIGVDINPTKLSLNPTKTVEQDMVSYLEEHDNIPNIFAHHSLEHVPNPPDVLTLVGQKLAKGGVFYAEVPRDDVHGVHHSAFSTPLDLLPEELELIESGSDHDSHYIIARKP